MVKSQPITTKKQVCSELDSAWKTGVKVKACLASTEAERLLCKQEALDPALKARWMFSAGQMDKVKNTVPTVKHGAGRIML